MDGGADGYSAGSPALPVKIVQPGESPAIEETRPHISDGTFHLALRPRPVRPMAFGLEPIVAGEVEEPRISPVGSDDDLPHVVVEDALGPTTEERERVLVA